MKKNSIALTMFVAVVAALVLVPLISTVQALEFTPVRFYVKSITAQPSSLILAGDNQIITWKDDKALSGAFSRHHSLCGGHRRG